MKNNYKEKILDIYKYAKSIDSDLSDKVLEVDKSIVDDDSLGEKEHITLDLIELMGLVDPDYVESDLKVGPVFMED
jgi:hypothetical protein